MLSNIDYWFFIWHSRGEQRKSARKRASEVSEDEPSISSAIHPARVCANLRESNSERVGGASVQRRRSELPEDANVDAAEAHVEFVTQ